MNYKTLADIGDIKGKLVLVRFDYNVPVHDGKVVDDFRIRQSFPTLKFLRDKGARIVIIAHIEGETDTLKPVFDYLAPQYPITFCEDCIEEGRDHVEKLKEGELILCENLRLYDGEKKNDKAFAEKLSKLGDVYVNDAFSVSHRKHASVVGVPQFLSGFLGLQFELDIIYLSQCFNPPKPFLFILGGAKFDTKLPLVQKFLPIADSIFIGGALANDFYKARGLEVGTSLVSQGVDLSGLAHDPKISVPSDVVVDGGAIKDIKAVTATDKILDAGPTSLQEIQKLISQSKCILWNGPLGNYENGYKQPTIELAKMIAESKALTIVGGGDTLATIAELGIEEKFSFISTGGGAMLDYLAQGTLPGLDALKGGK